MKQEGKRYAFLIGINNYHESYSQLNYPEDDVKLFKKILENPSIGAFNVVVAEKKDFVGLRDEIVDFVDEKNFEDTILLYFSGHGSIRKGRFYFITEDAVMYKEHKRGLEVIWVKKRLEDCKAKNQIVILDCCHSGEFIDTKGEVTDQITQRLKSDNGRHILASSKAYQLSHKDIQKNYSAFTSKIIQGIETGEADNGPADGKISVYELSEYVKERMKGEKQTPVRSIGGKGEIYIANNPKYKEPPARVPDLSSIKENLIPDHCFGCKSLNPKDKKCYYRGYASYDLDVDINEETGKGECYEESFFNQAKKLFDKGLWVEALDFFKKSKEISVKNEWADEVLKAEKLILKTKKIIENDDIVDQAKKKFDEGKWGDAIKLYRKSKQICVDLGLADGVAHAEKMIMEAIETKKTFLSYKSGNIFKHDAEILQEIEKTTGWQFKLVDNVRDSPAKMVITVKNRRVLEIGLKDCKLTTLPESIGNLKSLEYLNLMYNTLTILPESIGNLSSLCELNLRNNELTNLPESIGDLASLKIIYLTSNRLTFLFESIGNLKSLEYLHLGFNRLRTLPKSIGNLKSLEYLNLMYNTLTTLPESIGNLSSLRELNLQYNDNLINLPESITNLPSLETLYIRETPLYKKPNKKTKYILKKLKNMGVY